MSEDRIFNHSFPAPSEVPVPQPCYRWDPSFRTPEGIVGSHREFQGEGMDQVPSGSHTPFAYAQGEFPNVREFSGLGSESPQVPPFGEVGPAKSAEVRKTARVSSSVPFSPSVDLDKEEEEEADRDSVVSSPQVQDQTLVRLVNFMITTQNLILLLLPLSLCVAGLKHCMPSPVPKRRLVCISGSIPVWGNSL